MTHSSGYIDPVVQEVAKAYSSEFAAEVAKLDSGFLMGPPSASQLKDIAHLVIGRHATELAQAHAASQGRGVDASQIPAPYLGELNKRGVTESDVIEVAQFAFPDLTASEALKKWQAAAANMAGAGGNPVDGYTAIQESEL